MWGSPPCATRRRQSARARLIPISRERCGASAGNLDLQDALRLPRVLPLPGEGDASGVAATAQALEVLLREGRPEFREQPWLPHRPPRPEKSEGGQRFVIESDFAPKGDQPQAVAD